MKDQTLNKKKSEDIQKLIQSIQGSAAVGTMMAVSFNVHPDNLVRAISILNEYSKVLAADEEEAYDNSDRNKPIES